MTGTIVNTGAILVGSFIGMAAGGRMPDRMKEIMAQALGLCVIYLGVDMALKGSNPLLTVGCVLMGGITGELLNLEKRIESLAQWLKTKIGSASPTFVEGFVTASVIYLVGAMMILGCIADGVENDPRILYIKSMLDGVASIALASSLGVGVAFSAGAVLIVQGALTLGASRLMFLKHPQVIEAITSTGGVLILGIGVSILGIKKIRTANLLPTTAYAVAVSLFTVYFG